MENIRDVTKRRLIRTERVLSISLKTIRQNTIRVLQCAGMSPSGKPFEKHLLEPILKKHSFANFSEPILETILCGKPFWNQKHANLESIQNKKNNILGIPKNMESIPESIKKAKQISIGKCGNNHETILNQ